MNKKTRESWLQHLFCGNYDIDLNNEFQMTTMQGITALHRQSSYPILMAIEYGAVDVVKMMLKYNTQKNDQNKLNFDVKKTENKRTFLQMTQGKVCRVFLLFFEISSFCLL